MLAILTCSLFFFNCSGLYFSSYNCAEDDIHKCKQSGDVGWLSKKPMDVLIVLDNSSRGQELNSRITSNLNQFVRCMEAVDWRVGVISGVKETGSSDTLGALINMEISGQISTKQFITPHAKGYDKVFSDTISLKSGCSYPPYCRDGSVKPLSAVKSFMQKHADTNAGTDMQEPFLRKQAYFSAIVVSTSDEKSGVFSGKGTSAQDVLSSMYEHYPENKFVGMVVTGSSTRDSCIDQADSFASRSVQSVARAGSAYGFITANPLVAIASHLLYMVSSGEQSMIESAPDELMLFANRSGGYVFDICKPSFGKVLAYSLLRKVEKENYFPDECRRFKLLKEDHVAQQTLVQ